MRRLLTFRNGLAFHTSQVPYYIRNLPIYIRTMYTTKLQFSILFVKHISMLVLLIGLSLGLYTRWQHTEDITILMLAIVGLFVMTISLALTYYFSMETLGSVIMHLWLGSLVGMIAFTENKMFQHETLEEVMNILLITSLGLRCFWAVGERCVQAVSYSRTLATKMELTEMMGMIIASILTDKDFLSLALLTSALIVTLIGIRLKSMLSVLLLINLAVISTFFFFPVLKITVNIYALSLFVGRMCFEPLIDLYFSNLTTLERWQAFLDLSSFYRKVTLIVIMLVELTFVSLMAWYMPNHKEWFIVVPIFGATALLWLSFHLVFLITCWQLMNKITDCNTTYGAVSDESKNLGQIMASKGVRHFALISQRLVMFTVLSSVIVAAVGFETRKGLTISLFLTILPLECMVLSLLLELGSVLGGTCVGYALVAPSTYHRKDAKATVLPTNALQELGSRSTQILNQIQHFFAYHMVDVYGCDYSSSGIASEALQSKLKAFFDRRMSDGPRYDTYIVYYSGHVQENGDWALAGDGTLKYEDLLEWWREKNADSDSRLILVLDTEHSYKWAKPVHKTRDAFIALQATKIGKYTDPEEGATIKLGDFTKEWVEYNNVSLSGYSDINWKDSSRVIKAVYSTSRCWTDFTFHLPTEDEIAQHWQSNFPKFTRPLIKATHFCPSVSNLCFCCDCVVRCMRRKKMAWFPPSELDTGHGFKLVRS
ncbi:transmembrane protein 168-A [Lingula anatina]|uniref:Transmembrane protein 168 n=1 Tax=Lingula anatina TaxID=7574 RepID=A0A1S3IAL1_LINAN|nr:transmembrane protein 168-A [Lingula anatina]|eukprot:XP_013395203.1 transmembrane protein 168-A [Lingula anatina]